VRWARIVLAGVFAVVGLAVLGLVLLYAMQPTSYRISRSRVIAAPAPTIMAQLSDLHAFEAWQPWTTLPGVHPTVTYSPSGAGLGAWIDRRDASGGARTTITALSDDRIEMTNATDGSLGGAVSVQTFELRPAPGGTEVGWTLAADLHGLARLLWPFVHLEARIAPEMDAALTRLDRACR
jgi:hypothetical protein